MGLKHPHEAPALSSSEDNRKFTVMSYSEHPEAAGAEPRTYMTSDIASLQRLYGTARASDGDDICRIGNVDTHVATIWDSGGRDVLDASDALSAETLDLRPGCFSSTGTIYGWYPARENIAIAYGTTIDGACGGAGHDTLLGNSVANHLDGGVGDDVLTGAQGADVFVFGPAWGHDTVTDFQDGVDRIDFQGEGVAFSELTATEVAGGLVLSADAGTVLLIGMTVGQFDASDLMFYCRLFDRSSRLIRHQGR